MNASDSPERLSLIVIGGVETSPSTYSLETTARLAHLHPEMLRHYCRLGLLGDARARGDVELVFDDDALYELRRFEHYRRHQGVNRSTLRLLCDLWHEIDRLQAELRSLRRP